MTIEAVAWARDRHVPGDAGRVLEALANYANHRDGSLSFEPEWIAEDACISIAAVPRYLGALTRNKLLNREEKGREKRYWLNIDPDEIIPPWSWNAAESAAEADEAPAPRLAPPTAPARFQKAAQAVQRKEFSAPPAGYDPEMVPVAEFSDAYDAWLRHERAHGRKLPFVRSMVTKEGRQVRGVPMPSLFPPKEQEQIAV